MKAPINSEKHIVQLTFQSTTEGNAGGATIISAVANPTGTNPTEVPVGSIIKAVYVEAWLVGNLQTASTGVIIVEKTQNDSSGADATQLSNLHNYENKRNIFHTQMGLIGAADTNPVPMIRQWIKIPKGKQRFALGDQMYILYKPITEGCEFCGLVIFKAYT